MPPSSNLLLTCHFIKSYGSRSANVQGYFHFSDSVRKTQSPYTSDWHFHLCGNRHALIVVLKNIPHGIITTTGIFCQMALDVVQNWMWSEVIMVQLQSETFGILEELKMGINSPPFWKHSQCIGKKPTLCYVSQVNENLEKKNKTII